MYQPYDKETYKYFKKAAKEAGITVATREDNFGDSYIGLTVAFKPAFVNPECRMLEVAVSYCSPEDTYKRKHGKYQALNKFYDGEIVHLPLAQYYRDTDPECVAEFLLDMFTV